MIMKYTGHNPDIEYDPAIIQQFAQRLYGKARWLMLFGFTIGFLAGYVAPALFASPSGVNLLFAIFGGFFGYQVGSAAGLRYRIEAQQALCFVQIEKNTRP